MDRRRHKKVKNWDIYHSDYVSKWNARLAVARMKRLYLRDHSPIDGAAFNDYLAWFHPRTRLTLCPPAFEDIIWLDANPEDDATGNAATELAYNRAVKEGNQTQFAPVVNFLVISTIHFQVFIVTSQV